MLAVVALCVSGGGACVVEGLCGSELVVVQCTVIGASPAPIGGFRGMPVLCSV